MNALKLSSVAAGLLLLAACSKGGNLTLEPGARIVKTKGSPYVTVNQGGKALVVEQGKTATTGVHGWVSVQAVSSRSLSSVGGNTMVLNKAQAYK
jgi:hypothetical protein